MGICVQSLLVRVLIRDLQITSVECSQCSLVKLPVSACSCNYTVCCAGRRRVHRAASGRRGARRGRARQRARRRQRRCRRRWLRRRAAAARRANAAARRQRGNPHAVARHARQRVAIGELVPRGGRAQPASARAQLWVDFAA